MDNPVLLTIHRSAHEIGGNCIEIATQGGHRILLDAGRPLDAPESVRAGLIPPSPQSAAIESELLQFLRAGRVSPVASSQYLERRSTRA